MTWSRLLQLKLNTEKAEQHTWISSILLRYHSDPTHGYYHELVHRENSEEELIII